MVDGQTINQLRQDLNAVMEEISQLKQTVTALEKKTKLIEDLDNHKIESLIQLLTQNKSK